MHVSDLTVIARPRLRLLAHNQQCQSSKVMDNMNDNQKYLDLYFGKGRATSSALAMETKRTSCSHAQGRSMLWPTEAFIFGEILERVTNHHTPRTNALADRH